MLFHHRNNEDRSAASAIKTAFSKAASHDPSGNASPHNTLPSGTVRWHIIFYGRVQGVGFRYYSVMNARNLGLTGWVTNLPDGTVEMEVQGLPAAIYTLFDRLENTRYIIITEKEIDVIPVDPAEEIFQEVGW